LQDSQILRSKPRFGPFNSIQDFHLWLGEDLRSEDHPDYVDDEEWREIKEMAKKQDGPWPRPVFTYGILTLSTFWLREAVSLLSSIGCLRVGILVTGSTLRYGAGTKLGKHGKDFLLNFLNPTLTSWRWKRHAKDGREICEIYPNPTISHSP
jgi:hypothetical protein